MPSTVHQGLRVSYEVVGAGEPVLFLPGTTTDSSVWIVSATTYLDDFRCLLIDPRDTAKSGEATAPYAPSDLAAEALAVLADASEESAHVVGYSLGGTAAQELALAAPERVRSLTLVCSWAKTDAKLRHVYEWLRDGVLAAGHDWADRALLWLVLSDDLENSETYDGVLGIQSARGQSVEALVRQLECDIAHDAMDRLPQVTCPALVIAGAEDIWIPVRYSEELAKAIPGARLEVVEGVGHGLPFERAEMLFTLLRSHIESV